MSPLLITTFYSNLTVSPSLYDVASHNFCIVCNLIAFLTLVMVVGTKALGASLNEATTGADLGGNSKYSKIFIVLNL